MVVSVYTDGSASTLDRSGGWGVVIVDGERIVRYHGGKSDTTSQAMELMAIRQALIYVSNRGSVDICTDSAYSIGAITEWFPKWMAGGKSPHSIKNFELIRDIRSRLRPGIQFIKVRGHSGDKYNEMADRLAHAGRMNIVRLMKGNN